MNQFKYISIYNIYLLAQYIKIKHLFLFYSSFSKCELNKFFFSLFWSVIYLIFYLKISIIQFQWYQKFILQCINTNFWEWYRFNRLDNLRIWALFVIRLLSCNIIIDILIWERHFERRGKTDNDWKLTNSLIIVSASHGKYIVIAFL